MSDALKGLPHHADERLLVGMETSDDAAVYRLDDEMALVSTVDFITPPVDDPWWFGQVAAANALSDVYAMGGRPILALNLVMFPTAQLDLGLLREILRGAAEKVAEAGASLGGGHSVKDDEPKFGLAVQGLVHPDRIWTNAGARPGDALVLTKPLGSGVLFNAVRDGKWPLDAVERDVLPVCATLSAAAARVAQAFPIHACTDVTGFGIAGHSHEMAVGAGVRILLDYDALPWFPGALQMAQAGVRTGSNKPNRELVVHTLRLERELSMPEQELLFDPQTSGGLLFSLPADRALELVAALRAAGVVHAVVVGAVEAGEAAVVVR